MIQTFVPLKLAIPHLDVSIPLSVVMTITFVPKTGAHRTLDANIPLLIVMIAINVVPNHAMLCKVANMRPSLATTMTLVLMIVVILTSDVYTLLRTVTTAILVRTTLVTTSKVAYTPQLYVEMVISVWYLPATPPMAAILLRMCVTTTIPAQPTRAIPLRHNATILPSFAMTTMLVLPMLVLVEFAYSPR
jgi:hypothetical protein